MRLGIMMRCDDEGIDEMVNRKKLVKMGIRKDRKDEREFIKELCSYVENGRRG